MKKLIGLQTITHPPAGEAGPKIRDIKPPFRFLLNSFLFFLVIFSFFQCSSPVLAQEEVRDFRVEVGGPGEVRVTVENTSIIADPQYIAYAGPNDDKVLGATNYIKKELEKVKPLSFAKRLAPLWQRALVGGTTTLLMLTNIFWLLAYFKLRRKDKAELAPAVCIKTKAIHHLHDFIAHPHFFFHRKAAAVWLTVSTFVFAFGFLILSTPNFIFAATIADDTQAEFDAGTYSYTQWDGTNSWVELDATGLSNGSGNYTSDIKDVGNSTYNSIAWVPERPIGKELPDNAATETAYNSGNANMTGNVLLMHINSENVEDSEITNNNHGIANGGATTQADSGGPSLGREGAFDGTDGDITIPDSSDFDLNSFTLSAWIKTADAGSGRRRILNQQLSGSNYWILAVNDNVLEFGSSLDSILTTKGTALNDNTWHHIAVTRDTTSNIAYWYIDGVNVGNAAANGGSYAIEQVVQIGSVNTGAFHGEFFNGAIDETAVYNVALAGPADNCTSSPGSAICNLYNSGSGYAHTGSETGLVSAWHMDESSWSLLETSGQNHTPTANGGVTYVANGKLNTAMSFSGVGDEINVGSSNSLMFANNFTLAGWVKIDNVSLAEWMPFIARSTITPFKRNYWFGKKTTNTGQLSFHVVDSGGTNREFYSTDTTVLFSNTWHYVAVTVDSSRFVRMYVDGAEIGVTTDSANPIALPIIDTTGVPTKLGASENPAVLGIKGDLDEWSAWNRTLSATEVADHYKRGVLKLKAQVRSCDDAACSGESFIGPDGTVSDYYEWDETRPITTPSFNLTNVSDNRYFQYKTWFETDSASYTPELKSVTVDYTLNNAPPNTPTNSAPTNGATGQVLNVTLTGSAYSDPDSDPQTDANWEVDDDSDFSSPEWARTAGSAEASTTVNTTNGTFANDLSGKTELAHNTTYYFRVRYHDGTAWSTYSTGTSFTTNLINTPTNSSPADTATDQDLNVSLTASAFSDDQTGHTHSDTTWQLDDDSDFSSPEWTRTAGAAETSTTINSTNGTFANDLSGKTELDHNTTYYWRVRYQDSGSQWSSYSAAFSFTTNTIATPTNSTPLDQATVLTFTPLLTASTFSDAQSGHTHSASQWQVDDNSDFSSTAYDSGETASAEESRSVPSGLLSNFSTYYWRVRYKDSSGFWSSYSTSTQFSINITATSVEVKPVFGGTTVDQGDSVQVDVQIINFTDASPINTATATINIYNPTGTKIVDGASMTYLSGSNGIYRYAYTIPSTNGSYLYEVTATKDSNTGYGAANFQVGTIAADIASALANINSLISKMVAADGTVNDSSATTTVFDTNLSEATNDHYNDGVLIFTLGNNAGQVRRIIDYDGTAKTITVDPALSSAPANGDTFSILGQSAAASLDASSIWTYGTRSLTTASLDSGSLATLANLQSTETTITTDIANVDTDLAAHETSQATFRTNTASSLSDIEADTQDIQTRVIAVASDVSSLKNALIVQEAQVSDASPGRGGFKTTLSSSQDDFYNDEVLIFTSGSNDGQLRRISDYQGSDKKVSVDPDFSYTPANGDTFTVYAEATRAERLAGEAKSTIDSVWSRLQELTGSLPSGYEGVYDQLVDISNSLANLGVLKGAGAESLYEVSSDSKDDVHALRNEMLDLMAAVQLNRTLLTTGGHEPVITTWYTFNSVVINFNVTNPTNSTQKIPFKAYLPKEVKQEDILDLGGLTLSFDEGAQVYTVSDEVELEGKESVTRSVELEDIWIIDTEEIDSLRSQTSELAGSLGKTSYKAQADVLLSDSNSRLDRIERKQKEGEETPQKHILTYRENLEELEVVKSNVESLKELISSSGAAGNMLASIGGINTVATWGIIIALVVGVGLLGAMFYQMWKTQMIFFAGLAGGKKLGGGVKALPVQEGEVVEENKKGKGKKKGKDEEDEVEAGEVMATMGKMPVMKFSLPRLPKLMVNWQTVLPWLKILGLILLTLGVLGGVIFGGIKAVKYFQNSASMEEQQEKPKETATGVSDKVVEKVQEELNKVSSPSTPSPTPEPKVKKVKVLDTEVGYLNVRSGAGINYKKITRVDEGAEFEELDRETNEAGEEWVKIKLEGAKGVLEETEEKEGWVISTYVK